MKLPFLNRSAELRTLRKLLAGKQPLLSVIYGRRRCGKSRLLQQLGGKGVLYYLADQSDQALQRQAFAGQLAQALPGFDAAIYPSWNALFDALNARNPHCGKKPISVILDEFPYLLSEVPGLPALIQKMIDTGSMRFHLVLCGSSQRMMRGLAFDETAPLYGRAREVIKIRPLKPGWIMDAFGTRAADAVVRYAVWGGVPRYWELAAEYAETDRAIRMLVLDRDGILHHEPRRLLLDDMRSDTQPHSLLAVIGSGVHRISEISARLGKPAMNLLRPIEILMELGLVKRDIPFGEHEKNSKRTLYAITDPFLRFWYRYVCPNLSALEQEFYDPVLSAWVTTREQFVGATWEDLARDSVPYLSIGGKRWKQAKRWWGKDPTGELIEIDIVAESEDGSSILLGEAKWGAADTASQHRKLEALSRNLPFVNGKKVITAFWAGRVKPGKDNGNVFAPQDVLKVLR